MDRRPQDRHLLQLQRQDPQLARRLADHADQAAFKQTSPGHLIQGSHQWIASDRLFFEGKYTYSQNHFVLDFTSPELEDVQGAIEISTNVSYPLGQSSGQRSSVERSALRRQLPAVEWLGGDHTFKFGTSWRHSPENFKQHYGGYVTARFRNGVGEAADLRRDAFEKNDMTSYSVYLNDSYRRGRLTLNVGVRTDYWNDKALPTSTDPNPIVPDKLPSLVFAGADSGVTYLNTAPRLGVTYDLTGRARTILKGSLARYYGIGISTSDDLNPAVASRVRYAWNDLNRDTLVQREELDLSRIVNSAGYNAANPDPRSLRTSSIPISATTSPTKHWSRSNTSCVRTSA